MKYLLLILILIGCSKPQGKDTYRYICDCEDKEKIAEMITPEMIVAANNKSDEEMEDVISELFHTGVKLHCEYRAVSVNHNGDVTDKLDSCESAHYVRNY